jgi:DNA-binding NarL/FixJ family response regulator
MQQRILLADDHTMTRIGLRMLLQLHFGFAEVSEVTSCHDLLKELGKRNYSHLILEIVLSDRSSLEFLPAIVTSYPHLSIAIFSMQPAEIYGRVIRQYGILPFLAKTTPEGEIVEFLRRFLLNEQSLRDESGAKYRNNPFSDLAPRETQILHYILKGLGTKQIAETLHIKMNTVSTVKGRIFEKTLTVNQKELMELAALCKVRS